MSAGPACPPGLPLCSAVVDSGGASSVHLGMLERGDGRPALPATPPEGPHGDTGSQAPALDPRDQDCPDSSTSPRGPPPAPEERAGQEQGRAPPKKQKVRTVFSQAQLCVLHDRFQRQKYLSLQQMQELSGLLDLTYKQVKTWFQNQRMKCKRWQRTYWPKNAHGAAQKGPAPTEHPGLYPSYPPGCRVNTPGNLPMWGSQTWSNPSWGGHSWNTQSWNTQSWYPSSWSGPCQGYGEEALQPYMQFQQSFPAGDVEATLETAGDGQRYLAPQQALELFLNYPTGVQPQDP